MKKLLFLLPLLAVFSCGSGSSNKYFGNYLTIQSESETFF